MKIIITPGASLLLLPGCVHSRSGNNAYLKFLLYPHALALLQLGKEAGTKCRFCAMHIQKPPHISHQILEGYAMLLSSDVRILLKHYESCSSWPPKLPSPPQILCIHQRSLSVRFKTKLPHAHCRAGVNTRSTPALTWHRASDHVSHLSVIYAASQLLQTSALADICRHIQLCLPIPLFHPRTTDILSTLCFKRLHLYSRKHNTLPRSPPCLVDVIEYWTVAIVPTCAI